jgi:SET domain-containing protein
MLLIETYIAESPGMGFGLFSKNLVPKGTVIWRFVEGFDTKVHKEKYESLSEIQKKFVDEYFWKEGDYLYSSCDHSVFQNHSSNPNSIGRDEDEMIAARDIQPNEEILVSYDTFDDDYDIYKDKLI